MTVLQSPAASGSATEPSPAGSRVEGSARGSANAKAESGGSSAKSGSRGTSSTSVKRLGSGPPLAVVGSRSSGWSSRTDAKERSATRRTSSATGKSSGTHGSVSSHRQPLSSSGGTSSSSSGCTGSSSSSGSSGDIAARRRSSTGTVQTSSSSKSDQTASRRSEASAVPEEQDDGLGPHLHAGEELAEQGVEQDVDGEVPSDQSESSIAPSWEGSEADWGEEKWLEMAKYYDAQRRPETMAAWEARKAKYPELFRSDVSVSPSYSQYQVPYWSVCRRRVRRAMRRISRQLAAEIEEVALLQSRALDGVRVIRCFSLGVRPHPPPPDPLTERERRRVEEILTSPSHA